MIDKHLWFMLAGGLIFGVFGILVLSLLIHLGFVAYSAPFTGGIIGIGFTSIGLIIGSKLYLR